MTREETLQHFKTWCQQTLGNNCSDKDLHMANNIIALLEQQPCDDAISRQAVLDAIMANCIWENEYNLTSSRIKKAVESLPPHSRRQGRWIKTRLDDEPDKICDDCGTYCWKCSTCGCDASGWGNFNYCPNCGAKMQEEKE